METPNTFPLSQDIELHIGDATKNNITHKFTTIYFDPPFNSARDYKLNCNSDIGFKDKWTDADYEKFIRKNIDKLYDMLAKDGTLFFHISSSCMFIPEKILRAKFKLVEPIFWKNAVPKIMLKLNLVPLLILFSNVIKIKNINLILSINLKMKPISKILSKIKMTVVIMLLDISSPKKLKKDICMKLLFKEKLLIQHPGGESN